MLRKDYLQRQFEAFGKVLAKLLSLKRDKDWEKFERELAEAARNFTSFEIAHVEEMNEDTFQEKILENKILAYDQKKILASLLFEKMSLYSENGESGKNLSLRLKCIQLYTHLANDLTQNEFDLEVSYRLDLLNKHE